MTNVQMSLCLLGLLVSPLCSYRIPKFSSSTRQLKSITSRRLEQTKLKYTADEVASPPIRVQPEQDTSTKPLKLGVLLLNLGGPESTKDVEGFLYNLFADPDIIRLPPLLSPLQKPLAYFIAKRRAPKSTKAYKSIGGGSPIVKYTQAQADLIQTALTQRGFDDAKCYFAMRYWNPFTEEVLETMQADGINTVVIIPLYPQYSISTSGSSLKVIQDVFYNQIDKWGSDKVTHTVVPAWYYRPGYIKAMAQLIIKELINYSPAEMATGLHVLYSAHGVPQSYIEAGDPYQRQIEECVRLVSKEVGAQLTDARTRPPTLTEEQALSLAGAFELHAADTQEEVKPLQYHLSFQSRVGPVQWLKPYTENTLEDLGASGVKNLIVVPVSFVSEHIETLEEIDQEYRELAEESGVTHWSRVPALNTDPTFIEDLADMVVEALESPAVSVAEAASQNLEIMEQMGLGTVQPMRSPLTEAEKLNGKFAMLGILGTTVFEMIAGHPVVQMVGLR